MVEKVAFELVSPERLVVSTEVEMVVVPGAEGDFGILPGHAPFISGVRPGVIETYNKGSVERRFFVSGGVSEATPERCTVLSEWAVPAEEFKAEEIEARISRLREDISASESDDERKRPQKELAVAEAILAAAKTVAAR